MMARINKLTRIYINMVGLTDLCYYKDGISLLNFTKPNLIHEVVLIMNVWLPHQELAYRINI